jgi:hypothetical protein
MISYKSFQADEAKLLVAQSLGEPYKEEPFRRLVANIMPAFKMLDSGVIGGSYIPRGFSDHIVSP